MKFATFAQGGQDRIGLVDEAAGRVRPVSAARDMIELIERYDGLKGGFAPQGGGIPLAEVELKAPIPRPRRNVICVGKNYREHAKEFSHSGFEAGAVKGAEIDEYPAVFTKLPSSVTGPGATVSLHSHITSSVDYEAELALVIGTGGRDIAKGDAYAHIFGYTIVNDVTARDRQRNHKQWFLGKALDGFCPMGPWIVTADEVDPENLDVKCWVNGELRQDANTSDLIFDIPTLVATISAGLTLEPGDVIATGTPAGVGIGFNPPKFLKSGDVVRIAISGLGELENRFV
ncbi:MAG TPA: fumarylacetoacetate hydrolase family protein [Beijerinckiaceae bacterium]|jgi:2-keto-4-pentenoate hydratase/2-oxohepta-3-ene-1,7-dioic acid hydratase in catechol pathway